MIRLYSMPTVVQELTMKRGPAPGTVVQELTMKRGPAPGTAMILP